MRLSGKIIVILPLCVGIFFSFGFAVPAMSKSLCLKSNSAEHAPPSSADNTPVDLKCPEDPVILRQKLRETYQKLLAIMGTGEGGKMDTPQKRKAYEVYKFYKDCYTSAGNVPADITPYLKSLLVSCQAGWKASHKILSVVAVVSEPVPYESLKRVEISIRNSKGREFFRAMNNRMSRPDPIPPNAFGVYPVGEKERLTDWDIKDTGHGAVIPVKTRYGSLVEGCKAVWHQGLLRIEWLISPKGWVTSVQSVTIFVKIVPSDKKDAAWIPCGHFRYPAHNIPSDTSAITHPRLAAITPRFYNRFNRKKIKKGAFSTLTLVKLKRAPATAVIIQKKGDRAEKYSYVEVSRKSIDLRRHPSILLAPGFYQFKYNSVQGKTPHGFYGKSEIFEAKPGNKMEVLIWVYPAI